MRFDFLLCSERSGSNLITKIMDSHPSVCGPFPSHLMRTFCTQYYRYGDLCENGNWCDLTQDVAEYLGGIFAQWESTVTAAELRQHCPDRSLTAIIRYVYAKEAATRGKTRVFVKENHAHSFIPFTLAAFPDGRFVWLVRDPRDMALCQRDSILPGGVQTAARVWKEDQARSLAVYGYLRDSGRLLLLYFEDLLSRATATVQRLCEFLELPYDSAMLAFHEHANVIRNAATMSAWSDLARPLMVDNYGRYRTELSANEIRFVEAYCREEMAALGYAPEYPGDADVEELRAMLPEEKTFNHARSPSEQTRYAAFSKVRKRLASRWAERAVVRIGAPSPPLHGL